MNEESSEEKAGGRWLHQRVYREVARGFVQCLFGGSPLQFNSATLGI